MLICVWRKIWKSAYKIIRVYYLGKGRGVTVEKRSEEAAKLKAKKKKH